MKKVVAKVTKKELDAMIQEELAKMKQVMALKERKEALQKEIKQLKEEYGISEVKASGHKDKGDAYYMQGLPVQDFEEKRNGSEGNAVALKEMDMEMDGPEMEGPEEGLGELEAMFAELGRKLDAVLCGDDDSSSELEIGDDLGDDLGDDMGDEDALEVDEVTQEIGLSEEDIVKEEASDDADETVTEEDSDDTDETVTEEDSDDADETIDEQDGDTVVNAADQDTVNDNMNKVDNKNKMADELYEGKKVMKEVKHTRLNPENNPIINEEIDRMKRLANL